jgi:hypothetical protein
MISIEEVVACNLPSRLSSEHTIDQDLREVFFHPVLSLSCSAVQVHLEDILLTMPPKRKSKDAPSSNNPPPSRARVDGASKRSSAPDGNDQDSDAFVPKPAKRARKAPARTARLDANIDDELADIGR